MAGVAAIHYAQGSPAPAAYGRPRSVIVAQWHAPRVYRSTLEGYRAAGAEVLMYVLPPHSYPHVAQGQPEQALWYNGGGTTMDHNRTPREWWWDPDQPDVFTVHNYAGRLMDLRPGSAWVEHTIACMRHFLRTLPIDGFLLDTTGSEYLGWVRKGTREPTSADLNQMRAAHRAYVSAVREALGPEVLLVNNNGWSAVYPAPERSVNGVLAENHDPPDDFWRNQLARISAPLGRRRNISLSRTIDQARAWAATGVADHVAYAPGGNYSQAPLPPAQDPSPWPASAGHIPGWVWTDPADVTPPPPDPEPEPDPEPTPGPARPVISAELASAIRVAVEHRANQQRNRARTVLGPEYVGRLREHGLDGLADALERHVAQAIASNADTLAAEVDALLDGAEVI